ncbi:MAG: DNA-3-methyladenine glycosylase 2 family protein [Candidatus Colwellbacteria bacterium]|nr:DNA-3-methyladenine glycosylase 2 family protein [Candidatus Colwellbacteria bacterium]
MRQKVKHHFRRVDPVLFGLLKRAGELEEIVPRSARKLFPALCGDIVAQQLSSSAARTIFKRFAGLFPRGAITPRGLLELSDEAMRKAGMSRAKVRYLKDLARAVASGEVRLSKLAALTDEEAIQELLKIQGIGRWTAEMFLIFSLGREDVFSHGDLGLRMALRNHYGERAASKEEADRITDTWSPYRTWGARILWKLRDET